MRYEQFQQAMLEGLKAKLKGNVEVSIQQSLKNNNQVKVGILFLKTDEQQAPVLYLENCYSEYQKGASVEGLVEKVLEMYAEIPNIEFEPNSFLKDVGVLKKNVVFKLLNTKQNQKLSEKAPHREQGDLSIFYYCIVKTLAEGEYMSLIENRHMEEWGMEENELFKLAYINTRKLSPLDFFTMRHAITEILGQEEPEESEETADVMYVLTNKKRSYGAVAMLYGDMLETIADKLKEDYYILPSSVHEIIILPQSKALGESEINEMIQEINESIVEPEECLSDHFYYYSREDKKIIW